MPDATKEGETGYGPREPWEPRNLCEGYDFLLRTQLDSAVFVMSWIWPRLDSGSLVFTSFGHGSVFELAVVCFFVKMLRSFWNVGDPHTPIQAYSVS